MCATDVLHFACDGSGKLVYLSETWERYCSVPREIALSGAGWMDAIHHADLCDIVAPRYLKTLAEKSRFEAGYRLVNRDGFTKVKAVIESRGEGFVGVLGLFGNELPDLASIASIRLNTEARESGGNGVPLPHAAFARGGNVMVGDELFSVVIERDGRTVEIAAEFMPRPEADLYTRIFNRTMRPTPFQAVVVPYPDSFAIWRAKAASNSV